MTKFSQLSDAEEERLYLILEEASEIVKAASKILRHGYEVRHFGNTSNREDLEKEIGDFIGVMKYAIAHGDLNPEKIFEHQGNKMPNAYKYLHHNLPITPEEV